MYFSYREKPMLTKSYEKSKFLNKLWCCVGGLGVFAQTKG